MTLTSNQNMSTTRSFLHRFNYVSLVAGAALLLAGCRTASEKPAAVAPVAPVPQAKAAPGAIRIKAAGTESFKDSNGNVWLADQGFAGGDTVERPELTITNTPDQRIYQSERYSMTGFTQALPNGKYTVKLHFCETYDGITAPGQRVFSFNVAGHEFKDFDVWVKAGGMQRAYIETVPVDITNGKLDITFMANIENPQINGIEIIPAD